MVSKHIDLRVSPSEAVFVSCLPGRLEVKVCGNELLLPRDTYNRLQNIGSLRKASDLFLFFEQAAEDVAHYMSWAPQHVYLAHWYLADLLQHHLPEGQISYPPKMEGSPTDFYEVPCGRYIQ